MMISMEQGVVDPYMALPPLAFASILTWLDAKTLFSAGLVSRAWRDHAIRDELWKPHCDDLWRSKAYLPKVLQDEPRAYKAYSASHTEQLRKIITEVSPTFGHACMPIRAWLPTW